jgi:hypothetical protein
MRFSLDYKKALTSAVIAVKLPEPQEIRKSNKIFSTRFPPEMFH